MSAIYNTTAFIYFLAGISLLVRLGLLLLLKVILDVASCSCLDEELLSSIDFVREALASLGLVLSLFSVLVVILSIYHLLFLIGFYYMYIR